MTRELIVRELRAMLAGGDVASVLTQHQYDVICAAIRALGGQP